MAQNKAYVEFVLYVHLSTYLSAWMISEIADLNLMNF